MKTQKANADIPHNLTRRSSLGDEVYETLLTQLISLKILPGERISVDTLAHELGVSQTPIRAALIRLEAEGLVAKKHNSGYSAAPMPTCAKFKEIYEIRLLLEPHATAKAAKNMTDGLRNRLQETNENMAKLAEGGARSNYGKFALQDALFHSLIAQHSENTILTDTLDRLYTHMHLFRLRFHTTVTEEAIHEHALIITALGAGDSHAASTAMKHHILSSRARMLPFFEALEQQ